MAPRLPEKSPIRVLLVDDHVLFRRGIASVFHGQPDYLLVGEAGDGLEAVEKALALAPDVVLMDINMPRCNGLEATLHFNTQVPAVRVLMLTVSEKEADLFSAIRFGARGYLLKDAQPQEVLQAVGRVAAGEAVFSPAMAAKLLEEFKGGADPPAPAAAVPEVSPRENEVLRLVAGGASNREIAAALSISENTVRTHLKSILEKLHLKNRSQAAAHAARLGLTH